MLRMRRGSLHLLPRTNRICGVSDDFVSNLKISEDLYIAVYTQTSDHIHPFRLPITYSLNEGALLIVSHSRDWNEHRWSSAMDRPLHIAEAARRQAAIGAMDVQLDGHSSGIQVHSMSDARNGRMKSLTRIGGDGESHLLAHLHFSH